MPEGTRVRVFEAEISGNCVRAHGTAEKAGDEALVRTAEELARTLAARQGALMDNRCKVYVLVQVENL